MFLIVQELLDFEWASSPNKIILDSGCNSTFDLSHWKLWVLTNFAYWEVYLTHAHVTLFHTVDLRQRPSQSLIWGKYVGCKKWKAGFLLFIPKTSSFRFPRFLSFPDRWSVWDFSWSSILWIANSGSSTLYSWKYLFPLSSFCTFPHRWSMQDLYES